MRREAVIRLMALIAIITLAVSSVGISLGAEAAKYRDVSIKKIVVNITELERTNGEVTAVLFNMSVFIDNQNPDARAILRFGIKGEGTDQFIYSEYNTTIFRMPATNVININEEITNKYIIAFLTQENPIIYVHCAQFYRGEGFWEFHEDDLTIKVHNGSGSWPPPEPLQERPETIFAIAGLIIVAYMLLQPKKKNLKIRTAAHLGLLCIVLNLFSLGILFIFVVSAILAYSCLLLKQKWSATLVMFVYSIIGAAIMVFSYLLFDVTSEWDYVNLAQDAAIVFNLPPTEGIVGFLVTLLFGVSIGIMADVIYAFLKSAETSAAIVTGMAITFYISFIAIGGLISGPLWIQDVEGPFWAIVLIILFPMSIFGALSGYLGYFFYKKRRKP